VVFSTPFQQSRIPQPTCQQQQKFLSQIFAKAFPDNDTNEYLFLFSKLKPERQKFAILTSSKNTRSRRQRWTISQTKVAKFDDATLLSVSKQKKTHTKKEKCLSNRGCCLASRLCESIQQHRADTEAQREVAEKSPSRRSRN
jgi:hypothetical protein